MVCCHWALYNCTAHICLRNQRARQNEMHPHIIIQFIFISLHLNTWHFEVAYPYTKTLRCISDIVAPSSSQCTEIVRCSGYGMSITRMDKRWLMWPQITINIFDWSPFPNMQIKLSVKWKMSSEILPLRTVCRNVWFF